MGIFISTHDLPNGGTINFTVPNGHTWKIHSISVQSPPADGPVRLTIDPGHIQEFEAPNSSDIHASIGATPVQESTADQNHGPVYSLPNILLPDSTLIALFRVTNNNGGAGSAWHAQLVIED